MMNESNMELDLISRQDAIRIVDNIDTWQAGWRGNAIESMKALPSAQPEIIKCRDCKYWDKTWTNDWAEDYHYCPMVDGVRKADFYCADAERITDE